jgi:transcriptional regulator with XRE-family HTH domain
VTRRSLRPYTELADVLTRLGASTRDARRARGLTIPAAAEQIGIGDTTLWQLETGSNNPTVATALLVLRWLDTRTVQPVLTRSRP